MIGTAGDDCQRMIDGNDGGNDGDRCSQRRDHFEGVDRIRNAAQLCSQRWLGPAVRTQALRALEGGQVRSRHAASHLRHEFVVSRRCGGRAHVSMLWRSRSRGSA